LRTARLLAKHQGFSRAAAQGLLRSLAFESLATARDMDQLRAVWQAFDMADRRDAFVAARAAVHAAGHGAFDEARAWLRPLWERLTELGEEERTVIAEALAVCAEGINADWLPRLEAAAQALPRDGAVALAVGTAFAERGIWGKARTLLEAAADDLATPTLARRRAWLALARIAREQGDAERAARCHEAAATVA
jgi:HemY protein